jgi:RNA polymerase sigma-70 factor (ECF subfamily)
MQAVVWEEWEEARLVAAAQVGDLKAFDRLAQRYRPAAVVVASQVLGSREAAEDAAQDALLAAYKALPQLEDRSRFASWLGMIVRNRARRIGRGSREMLDLDRLILAHAPSIVIPHEQRELSNVVRCAVQELPPDLRVVVQLYYLEDWSTDQVARFLSLPLTTVKWRLHHARRTLRPRLAESLEGYYELERKP